MKNRSKKKRKYYLIFLSLTINFKKTLYNETNKTKNIFLRIKYFIRGIYTDIIKLK